MSMEEEKIIDTFRTYHRRDPEIGTARRPRPGTPPKEGLIFGSFSTTMSASQMCRE